MPLPRLPRIVGQDLAILSKIPSAAQLTEGDVLKLVGRRPWEE